MHRLCLLAGRMFVNKWFFVVALLVLVGLEIQIIRIQTNVPKEWHEIFHGSGQDHLREVQQELLTETHQKSLSKRQVMLEEDKDEELIILYNRVPKTGSTSFMGIIYDLCLPNKFHAIHLNISRNSHVMSLPDQMHFARNITSWKKKLPAVYHGHVAYFDFERLGVYKRPLYINIVRKPLDRLISYYYFLRFGDTFRPYLTRSKQGDKETFDECVQRGNKDCSPEKLWLQIPFFCGHAPQCWSPGSKWALAQAKKNLVEKYLLVGVTEEIGDFIAILEATVPRIFKGATKLFNEGKKSHLRKTASKKPVEQATIQHFEESKIWKLEQEFYDFAYKIFQDTKKRVLISQHGGLTPYHYEKIRPVMAS